MLTNDVVSFEQPVPSVYKITLRQIKIFVGRKMGVPPHKWPQTVNCVMILKFSPPPPPLTPPVLHKFLCCAHLIRNALKSRWKGHGIYFSKIYQAAKLLNNISSRDGKFLKL